MLLCNFTVYLLKLKSQSITRDTSDNKNSESQSIQFIDIKSKLARYGGYKHILD